MIELNKIIHADCLEYLKTMPDNSVDSIVPDPPYGLSFMGKKWDYDVPAEEIWRECLRVLKPGGHLLAFAGTRTQHRMAVRIEDAGFEIRDMIAWIYGSGFPKSLDVSKAIDKEAGVKGEVIGERRFGKTSTGQNNGWNTNHIAETGRQDVLAPATDDAEKWNGWGTALKPALEPITVARKPLSEKTVAANVLKWGTGAINIDGGRVGTEQTTTHRNGNSGGNGAYGRDERVFMRINTPGRFPANLIHDGSEEVLEVFPETAPAKRAHRGSGSVGKNCFGYYGGVSTERGHDDNGGSAARFFYCAKASKKDRDEGLDEFNAIFSGTYDGNIDFDKARKLGANPEKPNLPRKNTHPTVKPTDLMRYLCRLVTPPMGVVLDPFAGSGSTGKAAVLEGFNFICIEREKEYCEISKKRIYGMR